MNTKIILKNIASYKEESTLETDKKINLVYGLNGTGKTIISNYLYGKDKPNEIENWDHYQECNDNIDPKTKILVYNEKFIESVLYEKMKGIFTLSSANQEAEENIKKADITLKEESNKKGNLEEEIKKNQDSFNKTKENILNEIWNIKEKYTGGDRLLDYCLEGLKGKKERLFDYLCSIKKPENKPKETIEDLKSSLKSIKSGNIIQVIPKIENYDTEEDNPNKIENHQIFKEIIIGSKDSSVSGLIKELNNSDWVKKGLEYLPEKIKESVECPFCQEKTITVDLADTIKKYFDENYQKKMDGLSSFENLYKKFISKIKSFETQNQENIFVKEKKENFDNLILQLNKVLDSNLIKIKNKILNPSQEIILKSSENQITELNQFIMNINENIKLHNNKIENTNTEKNNIKKIFWHIMRWDYNQTIDSYNTDRDVFEKNKKTLEENIKNCEKEIIKQNGIIKENQENTINVEKSVSNINKNLQDIGIVDFKIEKTPNKNSYFLKRESSNHSSFKTLSEGEKTVISFLYFLELCQGKEKEDEVSDEKIIVIDDPISSLSHIYIFNIAQFIKNNYQKVFILTHNLYFFHELLNKNIIKNKERNLFRITKNQSSQIKTMNKKEIKNDYESYWELLKDYDPTTANNKLYPIIPNVMRNILEYFFGFTDKSELSKTLNEIDNNKYGAFIRYMNRESHSDSKNINDITELNHTLFFTPFREVFIKSGYEKHYNKMMKD